MNTTEIAKAHEPVDLPNGNTVCSCGFGNDPRFIPFYGSPQGRDQLRALRSRDDLFEHLRGVAQISR